MELLYMYVHNGYSGHCGRMTIEDVKILISVFIFMNIVWGAIEIYNHVNKMRDNTIVYISRAMMGFIWLFNLLGLGGYGIYKLIF